MGGGCMGCGPWGTGGKGIGNKLNKNPKTNLGFIIIYFRVGFLILLFTYVNLYLLVLLFILSFIVSLWGVIRGVDILYLSTNTNRLHPDIQCAPTLFGKGSQVETARSWPEQPNLT